MSKTPAHALQGTLSAVVILVVVALLIAYVMERRVDLPVTETVQENEVTLAGKLVCLSLKDTTLPASETCTVGIQSEEGQYYALDFSSYPVPAATMTDYFDSSVLVTGTLVSAAELDGQILAGYDVFGLVEVRAVQKASP